MEKELTPIMISALQHYSYCPRQCALIHQEQTFTDNVFTVKGHLAHQRVDSGESGIEYGVKIERALPLFSEQHGLIGKADLVEFDEEGVPYPVEYKQGSRQKKAHDDVQLGAQALCLEEMTGQPVPEGAIYHHKSRRRRRVPITPALRQQVISLISEVRVLLESRVIPSPTDDPALCSACSLRESCQPELVEKNQKIGAMRKSLFNPDGEQ